MIPKWMILVYIWVLRDGRELKDLWISKSPTTGKLLISSKERTPPAYIKLYDMKDFIEEGKTLML